MEFKPVTSVIPYFLTSSLSFFQASLLQYTILQMQIFSRPSLLGGKMLSHGHINSLLAELMRQIVAMR